MVERVVSFSSPGPFLLESGERIQWLFNWGRPDMHEGQASRPESQCSMLTWPGLEHAFWGSCSVQGAEPVPVGAFAESNVYQPYLLHGTVMSSRDAVSPKKSFLPLRSIQSR